MSSRNIPNDQFRRMLNDIGALALGQAYKGKVNLQQGREDASYNDYLVIPQQEYIEDYLECAKKLINLWPNIQKRPLKEISKQASWIAREKAVLTESGLKAFVKHTHKPKLLCQQNTETNNCSENKLLLQIVNALVERLAIVIRRDDGQGIDDVSRLHQFDKEKQEELADCLKKLKYIKKSRFFDDVMNVDTMHMPTQRMLGTGGYSDIYNIFHQKVLAKEKDCPDVKKGFRKLRKLFFANISKDSKVYEIWCFLQLYKAFSERASFQLKDKIIDFLTVSEDGVLAFKKSTVLNMERCSSDGFKIKMDLCYEYDFKKSKLTPDFLVVIKCNGILNSFVFDAKWRNYQALENSLSHDIYETAYDKYKIRLTNEVGNLEVLSCFILHSDSNPKCEHWNGDSLFDWLPPPNDFKGDDIREHQIGAICLRPDNLLNEKLSKIVYMLLLYHVANRVQEVERYCPRCGGKGQPISATGWLCNKCSLKWWVNHCREDASHRIVKLGDNKSFHVSTNEYWRYQCPKCGDTGG